MSLLIKSKIDQRLYKSFILPNKLSCLLISDKDTEKSAAALNVNVGALEDPYDREGLAHFCEHMLFMGTTKFPNEAEYQEFISKNSGETNAYTGSMNTNYIFQVANNSLQGALERFSQFFTEPLFDPSCTEREMKAVDSEFNMNLQSDFWRKHQLMCWLAKDNNPMQKFMIGNLKTLQHPDTRDRLLQFHQKYYSSNVMKLVVYGQQPLDQLQQWTQELFSEIKNTDIQPPTYIEFPYSEESLGKILKFVPFRDEDMLELVWLTDYMHPHYKNCPSNYISHLFGHEGENSLLSLLIDEGLAQELSCGSNDEMRLYSTLNVSIKLTKKGLANVKDVISHTFQYLEILKQRGTQKWIFDEIRTIKKLKFEYLEKNKPFGYVSELARRMQIYPIEELLEAPYFMEEYKQDLFQNVVNSISDKNLIIFLSSKEFQGQLDQVEPHFNTQFSVCSIPQDFIQEAQKPTVKATITTKKLDLPVANIFLPKNTSILPIHQEPTTLPEKVFETTHSELWFKRDNKFGVPKALIEVRIYCNDQGFGQLAKTEILARLWQQLLKDHIREFNYLAETAYINSSVGLAANGLEISSFGFSDSMPTFMNQLFKKIKEFNVLDYHHKYETAVQKSRQSLENFKRQPPYQQVYSYQSVMLKQGGSFDSVQLLEELNHITWNDLLKFQDNWLKVLRFEWLISGNIPIKVATDVVKEAEQIMNALPLPKDEILEQRAINLPQGSTFNYTYTLEEETNSSVLLYYQNETMTLQSQIINDLIANILKSPFFSQLRTQEQLGYVVFSMASDIRGITGFNFLIQSNTKSPQYCQLRIRTFINEQMLLLMRAMNNLDFEVYKQSIRVSLLEKDYSLNQESQRYWSEIQKHQYIFDRRQQLLVILDTISLEQVLKFYEEQFVNRPRVMEIHALAKGHLEENEELKKQHSSQTISSSSVDWIKRRLPLYPDYYSML